MDKQVSSLFKDFPIDMKPVKPGALVQGVIVQKNLFLEIYSRPRVGIWR